MFYTLLTQYNNVSKQRYIAFCSAENRITMTGTDVINKRPFIGHEKRYRYRAPVSLVMVSEKKAFKMKENNLNNPWIHFKFSLQRFRAKDNPQNFPLTYGIKSISTKFLYCERKSFLYYAYANYMFCLNNTNPHV